MLPREVEDLGAFRLQGGQPQRAFGLIGLAQLCGFAFGTIAIQPALIERQHAGGGVGVDVRVGSNGLLRQLMLSLFHGGNRYRGGGMTSPILFPLRGWLARSPWWRARNRVNRIDTHIRRDFMGGVRSGVNGTPSFYVNGELHQGDFDSLTHGIGRLIARQA